MFRFAENPYMAIRANGSWHVKKIIGEVVGIIAADSTIIAELPQGKNGDGPQITEAYLLAAAPQLFEVCSKLSSILENNLIVSPDGVKVDITEIKKALHEAILRAKGCQNNGDEPQPHHLEPCETACRSN
jgi:hypothetical protein